MSSAFRLNIIGGGCLYQNLYRHWAHVNVFEPSSYGLRYFGKCMQDHCVEEISMLKEVEVVNMLTGPQVRNK